MTAHLCLIRHGQTDWNAEGRYQGQSDVPLNATGLDQAHQLADKLAGQHFDALYASDLSRARQTGEILAERLGLTLLIDPRLREICQGEWEGKTLEEIRRLYTATTSEGRANPATSRAPGGESVLEVATRMIEAANEFATRCPNGNILIASHGLAVATLICHAKNIPLEVVYSIIPPNAEPVWVEWDESVYKENLR